MHLNRERLLGERIVWFAKDLTSIHVRKAVGILVMVSAAKERLGVSRE